MSSIKTSLRSNREKTSLIQSLSAYLRFMHLMTIIRTMLDDIQMENQSMETIQLIMLVSSNKSCWWKISSSLTLSFLLFLDGQNPMPWLTSTSTYLPNELATNHVPYTDSNAAACLPSMASFRSQQATTYPNNGSEPTVPTGEALGKALQSVRHRKKRKKNPCLFHL